MGMDAPPSRPPLGKPKGRRRQWGFTRSTAGRQDEFMGPLHSWRSAGSILPPRLQEQSCFLPGPKDNPAAREELPEDTQGPSGLQTAAGKAHLGDAADPKGGSALGSSPTQHLCTDSAPAKPPSRQSCLCRAPWLWGGLGFIHPSGSKPFCNPISAGPYSGSSSRAAMHCSKELHPLPVPLHLDSASPV